jgi:hypothetical protein
MAGAGVISNTRRASGIANLCNFELAETGF